MSSINSRVPPLRLAAVDTPSDGQVASYQSSSGQFEWVDTSSVSPGGTSGSIQYNDGAGGFTGSTKMIYDDTDAKITLTTGGNTLFIDAGGSPQLSFDGTGTGNIPTIAGDGGEAGGTGLLLLGNNSVSNNYMWFNKGSDQIQIIAPSASESIKINSNNGGNIEITATGGSQDVILSAATGNVKIEGLSYPTSDGTANQVLKTDGLGVLSFTDAATGTVTGTGTANQVSYWTSTTAQAGSTGLTYNPSTGDLTVGGYVETGTKVTTPSGTNLELVPGGASSGSIVIADGANGQISLNPNGTGTVKIDGVEIDNTAIATGYVLKATSTTAAGWEAESGGGSPGGSDTQIQYNNGGSFGGISSFTYDDTASSEKFVIEASSDQELVRITQTGSGDAFVVEDAANPDSSRFAINNNGKVGIRVAPSSTYDLYVLGSGRFNSYLESQEYRATSNGSATDPKFTRQSDLNTGMYFPAADNLAFTTGGTEKLRISSSGEIGLSGENYGSSGQVLTSNGSGSAASWADAGGSTKVTFEFTPNDAVWSMPSEYLGATVLGGTVSSRQWSNSSTRIRPHFIQQAGTLDKARIWVQAVPTATDQTFTVALWNSDTSGGVGTLKCQSTFTIGTAASPGVFESGWVAETGESLSVDIGDLYWVGFYSSNGATSTAAIFYFIRADEITHFARRDNESTGYSSSVTRFYASTSGSPSTLGDNPTINKGDGGSSGSTGVWPFMWYTVT